MEQRKFQRFSDNSHVVFTSETLKGEGRLENLSLGGAAILTDIAIARGEYTEALEEDDVLDYDADEDTEWDDDAEDERE